MMKKPLLLILFLNILAFSSSAQVYKVNIEKNFDTYYSLIAKGEFEQSTEYVPDDFFKIIPKQQMVALMKQLLSSKEFEFKVMTGKIKSIKAPKLINGKHYALFNYESGMSMKFNGMDTLGIKEKSEKLNLLSQSLKIKFGEDHVKLDDQTNTFLIYTVKKSCAISLDGLTNWKFVNIENGQKGILLKILPAEIIDEI